MSTALLGEKLLEFARIDSPAASLLSMLKVPSGGVSASGLLPGVYTLRYHEVKGCNNFRTHHKSRLCAAQHKAAIPQYMREMDSLKRKNSVLVVRGQRAGLRTVRPPHLTTGMSAHPWATRLAVRNIVCVEGHGNVGSHD